MSQVCEFIGGPLDGHQVALRSCWSFLWIDTRKGHIRYRQPGRHRALYRRMTTSTYLYAGHTHALCGGCGAFHERVDGHVTTCSCCGGRLVSS